MEEWEIIEEAPDFLVSNLGRVMNRTMGKIIKPYISSDGYPEVNLVVNGEDRSVIRFQRSVHRLVANAFVNGKSEGLVVKHIDGDNTNNRSENLKWVTRKESTAYSRERGFGRKLKRWVVVDGKPVEVERD
jgi:hypothetical protein